MPLLASTAFCSTVTTTVLVKVPPWLLLLRNRLFSVCRHMCGVYGVDKGKVCLEVFLLLMGFEP